MWPFNTNPNKKFTQTIRKELKKYRPKTPEIASSLEEITLVVDEIIEYCSRELRTGNVISREKIREVYADLDFYAATLNLAQCEYEVAAKTKDYAPKTTQGFMVLESLYSRTHKLARDCF